MIEQHYYTRERKGIFSRTPGYDSVAKSENLEDDFIINYLHDLCFYEAPSSLVGEEDASKYPISLLAVNTEDNRLVIGQSTFVGKDYTGQRNRYFTHNYIISEEERNEYIENPERIIFSGGFIYDYNIDKGAIISEVAKIEQNRSEDCFKSIDDMFLATNMCNETFIKLIKASFDGAKYGKKIYIVLDSDSSCITTLAKGVLKYLYRVLPFEIRRKIGFTTYMKEAKNKNLINIVFLCKGSIKRITTEIKAGYVFDLADNSFCLDGLDEENHIFLQYVMNNIENGEILKSFFYKADKILSKDNLSIYVYDNIIKPIEEKKETKERLEIENGDYNYLNENELSLQKNSKEHSIKDAKYREEINKKLTEEKKSNVGISIDIICKKIRNFITKIKNRFIR